MFLENEEIKEIEIVQYQEHLDNIFYKKYILNEFKINYNISKKDILLFNNRFFYYIIKDNYKIINIDIYKKVFTYYDTYNYKDDLITNYCNIVDKNYKDKINNIFPSIIEFISTSKLYKFSHFKNNNLYFHKVSGKIIKYLITKKDFYYLKKFYDDLKNKHIELNPFSSLLTNNLVKTKDHKIYIIDLKQIGFLNYQINMPFFIILKNEKTNTGYIYTEEKNKNYNFNNIKKEHSFEKIKIIIY